MVVCSHVFEFFTDNLLCTLLLPSGLCRCLWLQVCVYLHAALVIRALQMLEFVVYIALTTGALQMLVVTRLCLFACCSCHRGLQVLLVTSLCLFACCSCHQGFGGVCSDKFVFICMLLLPSGLCRCLNLLCTLLVSPELCRCL